MASRKSADAIAVSKSHEEIDNSEGRRSKRRRVALACNACRIRKSRCNGGTPRCSLCEQFDFDCTYESSEAAANVIVRKDYMLGFEQRLKSLEEAVKRHDEVLQGDDAANLVPKDSIQPDNTAGDSSSRHVRFHNFISLDETNLQELPPEETLTDGMAISFADEEDSGFFGLSSNIAFMRHISRAMAATGSVAELRTPSMSEEFGYLDNGMISTSRPVSPSLSHPSAFRRQAMRVSIYDLPPEIETRELIRRYFANTGLLFPYIHEPSFLGAYEELKSQDFSRVRRTWLGILNMILAMATSTHGESDDTVISEPDVFYQRAYELCKRQMLRGTSLETVQYLLLMSQYLQGTQKSVQTWAIHGLAVKAALSLGLHSTDAARKFPTIEREMRKRTWYGCVILDRSLSMTFGRPPSIPEDYVRQPLPEPLEDELSSAVAQGTVKALSVHFFVASITLYKVQWKIISTLYGQNLGCDQSLSEMETVTQFLTLEQELTQWQHTLRPELRLHSPSTLILHSQVATAEERFRVVLTLRHLNIQILLNRPFLTRSLDLKSKDHGQLQAMRTTDHMVSNSIKTCVQSSEAIISIVHAVITAEHGKHILGAWWFSLYYTFNAGLVIFGSLLVSPKHSPSTGTLSDQIKHGHLYLTKAIEAIRNLDRGNQISERCATCLGQLAIMLSTWADALLDDKTLNDIRTEMFLPQQLFQPQETGRPLEAEAFEMPQLAGNFDMDNFMMSDLELGQFFLPQEMEKWMNNGRGVQEPQLPG